MATDWRELSVLVVGCGSIGKRHARVLREIGATDIRACDPVAAQRQALVAESPHVRLCESYEAGLAEGVDTVLICTPPKMHVPMAVQAVEAGCHVLSEKPISDSTAGLEELVAAAEARKRKLMVGLCFRYHEGIVRAREMLHSGCVGRLVSVRSLMGECFPEIRPDYRDLYLAKYNGAFDLSHDIDLTLWFADQPVLRSHAVFGVFSDFDFEAPDIVEILIEFENRCAATVHLDFFQSPRRRQLELICTEGVIIVEFARWDRCRVSLYQHARGEWQHDDMETDRDDMFRDEDREFLQCVAEDRPVACTVAEAARSLEIVLAAQGDD